jgi:AraC family cel operon transcriptional repressor
VFREGAEGFVKVAGRSQEHVCRQTRRHLGLSPTQYVNRIRIQHAAMLLAGHRPRHRMDRP